LLGLFMVSVSMSLISLIIFPAAAMQTVAMIKRKIPKVSKLVVAPKGSKNAYFINNCTKAIINKFFQRMRLSIKVNGEWLVVNGWRTFCTILIGCLYERIFLKKIGSQQTVNNLCVK